MTKIDLKQFEVKPHSAKDFLKKHNIAVGTLANYLGLSYQYVDNMLNGHFRMPKKHEDKIIQLIDSLEGRL